MLIVWHYFDVQEFWGNFEACVNSMWHCDITEDGSGNGLLPLWNQAITCTNVGTLSIGLLKTIFNWTFENNLQWNLYKWCHIECNGVSNHLHLDCLLNHLFRSRPKKTSKLCITGLCEENALVAGEFPIQRVSNAENVSIWWCHHEKMYLKMSTSDMTLVRGIYWFKLCNNNKLFCHISSFTIIYSWFAWFLSCKLTIISSDCGACYN